MSDKAPSRAAIARQCAQKASHKKSFLIFSVGDDGENVEYDFHMQGLGRTDLIRASEQFMAHLQQAIQKTTAPVPPPNPSLLHSGQPVPRDFFGGDTTSGQTDNQ